jgi:hypothetical protein
VPPLPPFEPLLLTAIVTPFVVVEVAVEDEPTQAGQSIVIERDPALIRSICASLSGSAAIAAPASDSIAVRLKRICFMDALPECGPYPLGLNPRTANLWIIVKLWRMTPRNHIRAGGAIAQG